MVKEIVSNWRTIKEGTPIVKFDKTNINNLKFLDDGKMTKETKRMKDGSLKDISSLNFKVIDLSNNKESLFSTSSSRCIEALSNLDVPLNSEGNPSIIGCTVQIEAIGSGFSRFYKASLTSKPELETKEVKPSKKVKVD